MLTAAAIQTMQATQERVMLDRCQIARRRVVDYANPTSQPYAWDTAIPCGFDAATGGESEDAQAPDAAPVLRLAIGTDIASGDLVRITQRDGTTLDDPDEYAVVGAPRRGRTCLQVTLERFTEGSSR